jgi:hypothetical protein
MVHSSQADETVAFDIYTSMAYTNEVHSVAESVDFRAQARRAGMSPDEIDDLVSYLAADPTAGDVVVGTGGARKVRFAKRGGGKRGGYRVITFYTGSELPVFLIAVFSKGQRIDLSGAERNAIKHELAGLVDDYRRGVARYVRSR